MAKSAAAQVVVNHNIGTNNLIIQGTDSNNYLVTGTTSTNRIIVGAGYRGSITLQNVKITSSGVSGDFSAACGNGTNIVRTGSCMAIMGKNRASASAPAPNLAPVTRVKLVLEGTNELLYISNDEYCAIQVDEGAQVDICAIDPNDNASGTLAAKASTYAPGSSSVSQGGAAIGACGTGAYNGVQGYSSIAGCSTANKTTTAGGNVTISSGTITAWGGHAAGIGGAHYAYYNGVIIITGGVIDSRANFDAAGIGSGCPQGNGVLPCYADASTIIALPPAQITAYGAGASASGGIGTGQFPQLGLTGAKNITYIGDPYKPLITVRTSDNEKNANIYLDITQSPGLTTIFSQLGIDYNLAKVRVGKTDNTGNLRFNAEFQQNTTFYTDASSSNPTTLGRPYKPVTQTVSAATTIVLPLLETKISFTDYPSSPLELGYTATQAGTNAHRIKVEYSDDVAMSNVTFSLQDASTPFDALRFYGADGTTPIASPADFTKGMIFYISIPIKTGYPIGVYSDVLLIHGRYGAVDLPGYIRRIGQQRVVKNDTESNTYIKVTASPSSFTDNHPSSRAVTLTLNIDHTGMTGVNYDPLDVVAKYLVTTIADYNAALAASPLSGADWLSLNVAPSNNTNVTTTVSFSGKPQGTYYIHWYVESGVAYAHSLTVTNPPRTYGGFGAYMLLAPKIRLTLDKTSIEEGGGAAKGTATLTASLEGIASAPASLTLNLTYSGASASASNLTTPVSITIPSGQNAASATIVALSDYLLEGNQTFGITAPASIAVGGITYQTLGSPLSFEIEDMTDGAIIIEPVCNATEGGANGQVMFKLPGTGTTAVTCPGKNVKVTYSYSGALAVGRYTPNSVKEALILRGNNSVTIDAVSPLSNFRVEGKCDVTVTISKVELVAP